MMQLSSGSTTNGTLYGMRIAALAALYWLVLWIMRGWPLPPALAIAPQAMVASIALAVHIRFGLRLLPALPLAILVSALPAEAGLIEWVPVSIALTVHVALVVWALRRLGLEASLGTLRDVLLLLAGLMLAPALLVGTFMVVPSHSAEAASWAQGWITGSLISLPVTPLILLWSSGSGATLSSRRDSLGCLALLTAQTLAIILVFSGAASKYAGAANATWLVLPMAIWIAVTCEARVAALANVLLAAIAACFTTLGSGPFAAGIHADAIPHLVIFLYVVSPVVLLVSILSQALRNSVRQSAEMADQFRSLTHLSSDWYWEQDTELRFTRLITSREFSFPPGYDNILGKRRWELPFLNMMDANWARHQADLAARKSFHDLELSYRATDGSIGWIAVSGEPKFASSGKFIGYRGVSRDITARKLSAEATRVSEERFRRLVELNSDWYWETDSAHRLTLITGSREHPPVTQLRLEIGKAPWDMDVPLVYGPTWQQHRETVARREAFRELEFGFQLAENTISYVAVSGEPVFDATGQFVGYRGVTRDISERKRSDQQVAQLKNFYRALSEANSAILRAANMEILLTEVCQIAVDHADFLFARVARIDYQTSNVATIAHAGKDSALAHDIQLSINPDLPEGRGPWSVAYREDRRIISNDTLMDSRFFNFHLLMGRAGVRSLAVFFLHVGDRIWGSIHFYADRPHFFSTPLVELLEKLADNVSFALEIVTNREKRESAEFALTESEARFRDLTAMSSDWYWEQDENFRFTLVSSGVKTQLGLSPEQHLGRTREEILREDYAESAWTSHHELLLAHRPFDNIEFSRRSIDGTVRHYLVSGRPIFDAQEQFRGYRGIGRNITEMKVAEQRLRVLHDMYATLSEVNEAAIHSRNPDELFRSVVDSAVNHGPFAYVQIALQEQGSHWIRVALSGGDAPLPPDLAISSLDFERPEGRGATGQAMRQRRPCVCDDILADAGLQPWHASLSSRGIRSLAVYPLYASDKPVGVLRFYATSCAFFAGELHELLIKLAKNVSFALDNFERDRSQGMAEEALRMSEERFRAYAESASDYFWETDHGGKFTYVSRQVESVTGYRVEDMLGHAPAHFMPAGEIDQVRAWLATRDMQVGWRSLEHRLLTRSGDLIWLSVSGVAHFDADGNFTGHRGSARNITDSKQAEQALLGSEQRFRDFSEAASEFVWETDGLGRFVYVSAKVEILTGYAPAELIGRTPLALVPTADSSRVRHWSAALAKEQDGFRDLEEQILTRNGQLIWISVSALPYFDDQGTFSGQRGTARDVTEQKLATERINFLATRDPLTELPNRVLFNDRLQQGVSSARRSDQSLAVMFIDLDHFKNINDSLGHHVGDQLLKEVSDRMLACLRSGDTLSRIGGDEFVITLERLRQSQDAAQVARKILDSVSRPVNVDGHALHVTCSIGISVFPNDADDANELMQNADTAMYHAKEKGRNNLQFFSQDMNVRAVERLRMETRLRRALDRDEFVLHYQPQIDIARNTLAGVEALVRWQDPEHGLIPPAMFIAVAEETGLIEPLGQWVLETACRQAQEWQQSGLPPVKVAVNISVRQLNDSRAFLRSVNRALALSNLDARYLELEMTESLLLRNVDDNLSALRELGRLGTLIAVDDFGTGYSSLSYLTQLPIDTLKIDRTFVRDVETSANDSAIVRAVIAMAHGLKLRVIAEGVEREGQLKVLRDLGCDEYQGYLMSKPLPSEEFAHKFLLDNRFHDRRRRRGPRTA
jgi:diguanylate cyclase (GGDEF)-like protein/PAS domain S-box-containing protein